MSAALAAGLAVLLVLGGATDPVVLLLAVALVQALTVVAWFPALGVPRATVGQALVAVAALAADVVVLRSDDTRPLAHVGPVLAVALLGTFVQQLVRRDGRDGLTSALTATGSALVLTSLGSAWLAVDAYRDSTGLLVLAAVAAAATPAADLAADRLRLPRWVSWGAAAAATGAAAVVVAGQTAVDLPGALAAAAGAAVAARLGAVLAHRFPTPHPLLPAVLPTLLVAPATYVLARVLLG